MEKDNTPAYTEAIPGRGDHLLLVLSYSLQGRWIPFS